MNHRSAGSRNGLLLAAGSACFYGLNIVYARLASFSGVGSSAIVIYRVVLMLMLITVFAIIARQSLAMVREERKTLTILGVSTAFVGLCYVSSVAFIPVTVATVIFYTFPFIIVLASPLVEGTRLTPGPITVTAVASLGIVLVVGTALDDLDWRGLVLAACASIATAVQFFAGAACLKTQVVAKIFWIHLFVLPAAVATGLVAGQLVSPAFAAAAPLAISMTIGGYIAGFILQFLALGRITAVGAGIIYCIEPVVAAVSSSLILGEDLVPLQWVGGTLVIGAVFANVLLEQGHRKPAPMPAD